MTINEIYLQILSSPLGGNVTADNRTDAPYIYSLINTSFAQAVRNIYGATKKISPQWYLPYYPEYEILSQDDYCFARFTMPNYIEFDSAMDGLGYIGSIRMNNAFIPITSRVYLSDMLSDKTRLTGDLTYMLIENNGGSMGVELYGKIVKNFKMMLIPANPAEFPAFNQDIDNYPADSGLINEIKKIILGVDVQYIWKTRPDNVSNSKDETIPIAK